MRIMDAVYGYLETKQSKADQGKFPTQHHTPRYVYTRPRASKPMLLAEDCLPARFRITAPMIAYLANHWPFLPRGLPRLRHPRWP